MAYIHFFLAPITGDILSVMAYDELPYGMEDADPEQNVIVEYDYDPSTEFISSLILNEDRTGVVNKYPGKTVEEQKSQFEFDNKEKQIVVEKNRLRARIKSLVNDLIEPIENDEQKAIQVDTMNGNTEKQTEIALYRKSVRDANDAHEALLDSITDFDELSTFDPDWRNTFSVKRPSI